MSSIPQPVQAEVLLFMTESQEIINLKAELAKSRIEIANLKAQRRLLLQGVIALSDNNRYFASERLDRYATDIECFLHYADRGGAKHFDMTHPR